MKAAFLLVALEVCLVAPGFAQERLQSDIALLSSADTATRALAACRIASRGRDAEAAVPALLRLLADGTSITPVDCWSDRTTPGLEAARALGAIRSDAAIEPLLEALRSPNPELRRTAARALGLMMRRRR